MVCLLSIVSTAGMHTTEAAGFCLVTLLEMKTLVSTRSYLHLGNAAGLVLLTRQRATAAAA
jgi:hypothetical protein